MDDAKQATKSPTPIFLRLWPIYNERLDQWKLCHDQECALGESRAIAVILRSEDRARDARWAKYICDAFNRRFDTSQRAGDTSQRKVFTAADPLSDGRVSEACDEYFAKQQQLALRQAEAQLQGAVARQWHTDTPPEGDS
jgi:hypothetical protein